MVKAILFATTFLCVVAPAYAQVGATGTDRAGAETSESGELKDIVVTATKREQNLQKVSMSITAVTSEVIEDRALETLDQVTQYTPNVRIAGVDGPAKYVSIRGLGSGNNRGFETSVGLFMDGVYLGREVFLFDSYIDLARIEAIKGPQGALYGKNTIAGAISVITADPTKDFSGELSALAGERSSKVLGATVSGAITDRLQARLSAEYFDRGGYIENSSTGNKDGSRTVKTVRGKLAWEPIDALRLKASIQYADLSIVGTGRQLGRSVACVSFATAVRCAPPGISQPATAGGTRSLLSILRTTNGAAEDNVDFNRTSGPDRDGESRETLFSALQADADIGDHTLTYIGSYAEIFNQETLLDADATSFNGGLLINREDFRQNSHELRLVSPRGGWLEYIAGAYYFHSDVDGNQIFKTALGNVTGGALQRTRSISAFGQATANISSSLRVIGGARYIDEDKSVTLSQVGLAALGMPTYSRKEAFKDSKVLLNGSMEYDLADRVLLYGSYSQGYKAGGFNFFDLRNNNPNFSPETSDGLEVGLKTQLLDNSVRLNIAAFSTKFDNLQVSFFNGTANVVGNAASSRSKGLEAELTWQATDKLQIMLSGAYLSARYLNFKTAPCTIAQSLNSATSTCVQNLSGRPLERAPNFTGLASASYDVPLGGGLALSLNGDVSYSAKYYTAGDLDPASSQSGFALFNGRIALSHADQGLSLAIIGKNLANKSYAYVSANTFQFAGTRFNHVGQARQIDFQVRYKW